MHDIGAPRPRSGRVATRWSERTAPPPRRPDSADKKRPFLWTRSLFPWRTWRMSCPLGQGEPVRIPLSSHIFSGTAAMIGPGECASCPAPEELPPTRLEAGWNQSSHRDRGPLTAFLGTFNTCPPSLLTRRWTPPQSRLLRSTARTTFCSSGSLPLAVRTGRRPGLRLEVYLMLAANNSPPRKTIVSSETLRHHNILYACFILAWTRRSIDGKSVISTPPL